MTTYLKTLWNNNTKAKNQEIKPSANSTSNDIEANHSRPLDMKTELIANVSSGVHGHNISSCRTVEVDKGQDVVLTFVTESYPPLSNQSWTRPPKVNNNNYVTVYQESYSVKDTRLAMTGCHRSFHPTEACLKLTLGHFTHCWVVNATGCSVS